jgi:chemotaxis protein CheD
VNPQTTSGPGGTKPVEVLLQPGEYFVGDASHRVRTVLGSCVSMTLWCPLKRIGAMSHFLLASRSGAGRRPLAELDARYGDEALRLMLHELARLQVYVGDCQAKIFGGGDMFPAQNLNRALAVGRRNGEAARGLLREQGIDLISECLFGKGHRQIIFAIASGHVWSRQIPPQADPPATNQQPERRSA